MSDCCFCEVFADDVFNFPNMFDIHDAFAGECPGRSTSVRILESGLPTWVMIDSDLA